MSSRRQDVSIRRSPSRRLSSFRRKSGTGAGTVFLPLVLTLLLSGCRSTADIWNPFAGNPLSREVPCRLSEDVSKTGLIAHLNRNTRPVDAWQSTDVSITAHTGGWAPGVKLSATLAVQRPRNFRLVVRSGFGSKEVDFGSNDERFWFWVKRSQPKQVITAAHEHMHRVRQRLRLPFRPDWLMETMGVIPFDESEWKREFAGSRADYHRLVSEQTSASGRRVRRVIHVDRCHGHILEHSLYGADGKLIARASLSRHRPVEFTPAESEKSSPASSGSRAAAPPRIVLPHRIDLHWPQAGMDLTLDLNQVEVNPQNLPEQVWKLPQIADAPPLDIGRAVKPPPLRGIERARR